ncbi:MAG TPA: TIM-barrel domain-containing protein [Solirubrobacteraceae bacterium]|nr:TIM-barrel domain-containing protein [Solirubrobacteraceae bacterium]
MTADEVTLTRGRLELTVTLRPFSLTVRRDGRRLWRNAGAWVAEGRVHDTFIHFTEGVIAHEELSPPERAGRAKVLTELSPDAGPPDAGPPNAGPPDAGPRDAGPPPGITLALRFGDARRGTLAITLTAPDEVQLTLTADPVPAAPGTESDPAAGAHSPLRLALDWDRRSIEHFTALGVRHSTEFDHRGRRIQLGADRRYTGPDCPPEMLAAGGIPQGDCAPTPYMESSRGYAVLADTAANGTIFDLSGDRTSVSTRAHAGPLSVRIFCASTPLARLRQMCRATGFPALLPEWGYGFWKSRDVHEDTEAVLDDFHGFRAAQIPLDAVVIDSPWASQYNSWEFNRHQFPDAPGLIRMMREDGVRTVLWCTPWVNLDSRDGQIPPQPESERLHREPAPNYAAGAAGGHFVRTAAGEPWVGRWWMGDGSLLDFTSPGAEAWWREQVKRVLDLGVEGIKMDDGDGYYVPDEVRFADGRSGAQVAWENGSRHRLSLQRALDEVHPGAGVLFGRSGWTGQHATGLTWGADQASDFWSLRVLVVATLTAAMSGYSNFSHDIGGYLGHRLVERCPPELLIRWLQFGAFTPLMQAHSKMAHEPWHYGERVVDTYRGLVLLHEQLVPYVRAAAATAARCGVPIIRPLALLDPGDERGWTLSDAYGYGPALWVAPVLEEGVDEREVPLPRGEWIATWSQERMAGGGEVLAPAPLSTIPVWVRAGSIVVSYPAAHVARGLGDVPESARPLEAALWGRPRQGRAVARLADGTRIRWSARDGWSVSDPAREVSVRIIEA